MTTNYQDGNVLFAAQLNGDFAALTTSVSQVAATANAAVLRSGSTMTGPLILSNDPTQSLGAATKHYVDTMVAGVTSGGNTDLTAVTATANTALSTANAASANASTALTTANTASTTATNANTLAAAALPKTGGTLTGMLSANAGLSVNGAELISQSTGANGGQFRAISGNTSAIIRNDGSNVYLLDSATATGIWRPDHRPFSWNLSSGAVTIAGAGEYTFVGGHLDVQNEATIRYTGQHLYAPTGNASLSTASALNIQGTTVLGTNREFALSVGLQSTTGSAGYSSSTTSGDKVGIYSGVEATTATSGNIWATNFLCNVLPAATNVIAQGIEVDINNLSNDRTDNLAHPIWGISITGAGNSPCTGALSILGSSGIWPYGIFISPVDAGTGPIAISTIEDRSANPNSTIIRTNFSNAGVTRSAGIDFSRTNFTNGAIILKAGGTGAGNLNWTGANGTVGDWVDVNKNRVVGANAAAVFIGNGDLLPLNAGQSLGSSGAKWTNIWATNGTIQTSDITLKENVELLPDTLALVNDIDPIKFNWKDDAETHWGFSAQSVRAALDKHNMGPFGGHIVAEDGSEGLRPDQMIPILWQAVKQLTEELRQLKAQ